MYLTRLDLDMHDRSVRRMLSNEERVHAMLCGVFNASRAEGRILYRLVQDAQRQAIYTYSRQAADNLRLPKGVKIHRQRDLTEWINELHDGELYQFDLLAVPAKKVAREGAKNSRRVVLKTPEEREEWLRRKAEAGGFELLSLAEVEERAVYVYQHSHEANSFQMNGIRFSGVLRITNVERFREVLTDGIGAQRAYGYGMMLVKRV